MINSLQNIKLLLVHKAQRTGNQPAIVFQTNYPAERIQSYDVETSSIVCDELQTKISKAY